MELLETFCTDRLLANRLRAEDYGDLCRMHQNPKIMATLAGVRSDDWTWLDKEEE